MSGGSFSTAFSRAFHSFEITDVPIPPCQHVTVTLPGWEAYRTLSLYGPQSAIVAQPGDQSVTLIVKECADGGSADNP